MVYLKQQQAKSKIVPLDIVAIGDCFMHEGSVWMMCQEWRIIEMKTGEMSELPRNTQVIPLIATLSYEIVPENYSG